MSQEALDEGKRKIEPQDQYWAQQVRWRQEEAGPQTSQTHKRAGAAGVPDEGYWGSDRRTPEFVLGFSPGPSDKAPPKVTSTAYFEGTGFALGGACPQLHPKLPDRCFRCRSKEVTHRLPRSMKTLHVGESNIMLC